MADHARIKMTLEQRLKELTQRAVTIDDDLSQLGDDDWSEQAVESANDDVLEEIGDATVEEIEQIKLALKQIDAGSYGVCTNCKHPIGRERLEALPYATRCVKCA
jgi:DnaK suppressor protein